MSLAGVDVWKRHKTKRNKLRFYKTLIPTIKRVARECGYCAAIHGSMTRDLDILLVPWVEGALLPETVIIRIQEALEIPKWFRHTRMQLKKQCTKKPHGRRAWAVCVGADVYLDFSAVGK